MPPRLTIRRREHHGVAVWIADPELAVVRVRIAMNAEHHGRVEAARVLVLCDDAC